MAFVRFVGLYACRVKRLKVRKRKTAHFLGFLGFIGLLRSRCCFSWFVLWLSLGLLWLLRSCCLWVSLWLWVVVLFPFGRYDKKKGRTVLARPLFVGCGLLLFVC